MTTQNDLAGTRAGREGGICEACWVGQHEACAGTERIACKCRAISPIGLPYHVPAPAFVASKNPTTPPPAETLPPYIEADPWKHRSLGMRCATCIWFVQKIPEGKINTIQDQAPIGRCRRHAPSMGGYPVVYSTDWCGDHRLDENKA